MNNSGLGLSSRTDSRVFYTPVNEKSEVLDGWASLEIDNLPEGCRRVETTIATATLDSLEIQNVSFIKIDVEGHEVDVVKGGLELLAREKPVVLAEVRAKNFVVFEGLMHDAGLVRIENPPLLDEEMFLFAPFH